MKSVWTFTLLLLAAASLQAQDKQPPDYQYDRAAHDVAAMVLDNPLWYEADVEDFQGQLWYTWLHFTPGKGDRVWIGRRDAEGLWAVQIPATADHGEYANPKLTADAQGCLCLTYEAARDGQWDVMLREIEPAGKVGEAARVSHSPGPDIHHTVAAGPESGLWIAWQSESGGQFDILARHWGQADLTTVVSSVSTGDWHPNIDVGPNGHLHIVWDGHDGTSFDVYHRSFVAGVWSRPRKLTQSPAFEGRAQVAADGDGRAWVVWEEGGHNWGQPFRGINTEGIGDRNGPLHRFRQLQMAVVDENEQLRRLKHALPQPAIELAVQRKGTMPSIERSGAYYERARLKRDYAGRIWLAYRHYYTPWMGVTHRTHVEQGWGVYARCLSDQGWSALHRFPVDQGDGMQSLALTPKGDGVMAVWTTGRTHRTTQPRPRGVAVSNVAGKGKPPGDSQLGERIALDGITAGQVRATRPTSITHEETFQLFYGDLHRHTDLSLCRVPLDGTLDDTYRYAIEVARLDFLGITDHSRDLAQGNPDSQLWWRSRKEVLRHNLKSVFMPYYAYERSHGNTADHNVISLRGDMLRPHTYPMPQFWNELDRDTLTIPHQPIRRDTWAYQNDALRPLVEIFQGCRDQAIVADVHQGLSKGYLLGFIASSDHMSTSASYACVWAAEPTQESIFRAMQARRTYGATTKIELEVRAGKHWMGEQITVDKLPPLSIRARGTAPIRSVQIIVDGQPRAEITPNAQSVQLTRDLSLSGNHYVYVTLYQADGNQAWSSPIWIRAGGKRNR